MCMRKPILFVTVTCCILASSSVGIVQEDFPAQIDRAIEKGVEWLKARQIKSGADKGSWGIGENPIYGGGTGPAHHNQIGITALALYALLACDVPPDDPVIKLGFEYIETSLKKGKQANTYERATILMAIEALADGYVKEKFKGKKKPARVDLLKFLPKNKENLAKQQVRWLKNCQTPAGGWRYGTNFVSPGGYDNDVSATQFVLLGLKSASRMGIKVDAEVFLKALQYNLEEQEQDGPVVRRFVDGDGKEGETTGIREDKARGWAYIAGSKDAEEARATGSMTTAGVCSLIICKSELMGTKHYKKKLAADLERGLNDGLAWLEKNYTVDRNPYGFRSHYYYLYGLERVGMLGNYQRIGTHNWYVDGARVILRQQKEDGHWNTGSEINPCDVIDTCFALLFLKKATKPAFTK